VPAITARVWDCPSAKNLSKCRKAASGSKQTPRWSLFQLHPAKIWTIPPASDHQNHAGQPVKSARTDR
jgi:hypothetical protein